jgi:hypothetical protein
LPGASTCPARPEWAGPLASATEVEVLHHAQTPSSPHGTGYRLYADGRFETYDDINLRPDDAGRLTFQRVPGSWRLRGVVTDEARAELRALLASTPAAAVEGVQATKTRDRGAFTIVTWVHADKVAVSCYYGSEMPSSSERVVSKVHDLVNRVSK